MVYELQWRISWNGFIEEVTENEKQVKDEKLTTVYKGNGLSFEHFKENSALKRTSLKNI